MPIKPENRRRYPANWKDIVAAAKARTIAANGRDCCEGSPAYPDCRADNHQPHPVTGGTVVLTTAHVDHVPEHCEPQNIRRWCNRCHLTHDAQHHTQNAYMTRRKRAQTDDLFSE